MPATNRPMYRPVVAFLRHVSEYLKAWLPCSVRCGLEVAAWRLAEECRSMPLKNTNVPNQPERTKTPYGVPLQRLPYRTATHTLTFARHPSGYAVYLPTLTIFPGTHRRLRVPLLVMTLTREHHARTGGGGQRRVPAHLYAVLPLRRAHLPLALLPQLPSFYLTLSWLTGRGWLPHNRGTYLPTHYLPCPGGYGVRTTRQP